MFQSLKFKSLLLGTACILLATHAASARDFNIPQGDLKSALDSYAAQSGVQLIYSEDSVRGIRSKGVSGEISSDDALSRILSGTGFSTRRTSSGAIGIVTGRSSANQINPLQLAQATPGGRIEEVLVTARRREEAIENIPISITALSAEDLKTYGVRNFSDLEGVVPGLNMGGGGNGVKKDSSPFIRGVGQRETKVTLDSAVATYIDGIYIGRAAGAMLDVTDVANIQVLRGPQGTLFGRNATGGAITVSLNKPTNNWEANVTANIGNYGRRDISGMINVPFIEDKVLGRLFIASINSNGYFTNLVDNTKWGGDNRVTGIGQLRILPTDTITIDLLAERTRVRETPRPQKCAFVRDTGFRTLQTSFLPGSYVDGYLRFEGNCRRSQNAPQSQFYSDAALSGSLTSRPEVNTTTVDGTTEQIYYQPLMPKARYWVDTTTFGGTVNWDIGDAGPFADISAKSISAWRKTKQIADEDLDATGAAYLIRIQPTFDQTTQFSQEIQLSGKALNDRLFVSTGGYYFKEKTPGNDLYLSAGVSQYQQRDCPAVTGCVYTAAFEPAFERLETDNHSWAWYGQADFDVTPEIQLTGGVRWTTETRWSRYSKAFVDKTSIIDSENFPITQTNVENQASGQLAFGNNGIGSLKPVLDWRFGAYSYAIGEVPTLTIGKLTGDELSYTNSAWTPMFSAKYRAGERMLQRLSLDNAMIYATYSQGFHSGGVTAGALDYDSRGAVEIARSSPPCPFVTGFIRCDVTTELPGEGFGTADPVTFEPEKVTNYEIGFKMAALDRRLQINGAAFYMDYTDMQVTSTGLRGGIPVPFLENAGSAVIKGFEAEVVVMPTPQWRIMMTGGYTDADIKEWNSRNVSINASTGVPTDTIYYIDRSDERMPRVPRWQFFGSTEYNFGLGDFGTLTPSVGVRFASSIYHGFDRGSWVYTNGGYYYNHGGDRAPSTSPSSSSCTREVPAVTCDWNGAGSDPQADPFVTPTPDKKWLTTSRPTAFLDARLGWISADGKMEAALWGKNLFNKDDYLVGGIPLTDVNGATGQVFNNPRTFGLTFTYHFGEQ